MMSIILALSALLGALALLTAASPASPLFERQACSPATDIPSVSNSRLPNPFVFADGSEVSTVAEWECRQEEILDAFEQYEFGDLAPPPTSLTASFSGNSLSITVTVGGNSATFSASVSGGGSGGAIIAFGALSIPVPSNIARITFNNDQFAQQNGQGSRGVGTFYNLHGSGHSAGALSAWAWGVARIMDALEELGQSVTGIDPTRVGVTGCSRNGKGAFVAGALDERIALTIPQESGAGGASCWRIADSEAAAGKNIQTAQQIVGENVWFSKRFNTWTSRTSSLPYDHHMLAGLVAPRGLYVPENNIDWLGPIAMTGCMGAARLIYEALGVSRNFGFSLVGGHDHCSFPISQNSELTQFFNFFLAGGTTSPQIINNSDTPVNVNNYIDWTAPTLS